MKIKLLFFALALTILLCGCSPANPVALEGYNFAFSPNSISVVPVKQSTTKTFNLPSVSVQNGIYYVVLTETDTPNGEFWSNSTLFEINPKTNKVKKLFSDSIVSSYEDEVFVSGGKLAFHGPATPCFKAIDLESMTELDTLAKPADAMMRYLSPDMTSALDFYAGGINIQMLDKSSKAFFENPDDTYSSINWSKSGSNVCFISSNEHKIWSIDTEKQTSTSFLAENYNDKLGGETFVDLLQCFTNSSGLIATNYLSEQSTHLLLLNEKGEYVQTISSDWDSMICDVNDSVILYTTKGSKAQMSLVLYNIASGEKSVLRSDAMFHSACIADNTIVYTATRDDVFVIESIKR